jgi:dUTP pyrophosphatase
MIKIPVINSSNNPLPKYETDGAAGMDLLAYIPHGSLNFNVKGESIEVSIDEDGNRCIKLNPGGRVLIPTGLKIAIPEGFNVDIRPRSGLALKYGITVLNTPGLIDEDYRGDVGVILINHGKYSFEIRNGDKIAQMVLVNYSKVNFELSDTLPDTNRGEGGFGSTNK